MLQSTVMLACSIFNNYFKFLFYPQYDGITLSMINNGVLVKTGCNNINDFSVNHDRFYYVRKRNDD